MGGLFWAETARRIRARKCRTARPKLDGTQFTERFWTAICLTRTERDDGGIRRNVALVAPGRKGDGSDPGLGDTETGFLKLPLDPFGTLKPSVIGRRKLVCVAKQIQQCRIVVTGKPRRRESLRWCRLGLSSQAGFHQGVGQWPEAVPCEEWGDRPRSGMPRACMAAAVAGTMIARWLARWAGFKTKLFAVRRVPRAP